MVGPKMAPVVGRQVASTCATFHPDPGKSGRMVRHPNGTQKRNGEITIVVYKVR